MTVQTISPTTALAPTAITSTTTSNGGLSPLTDCSSLPHRLTGLSRQKLAREATAPDPDVRRCLAHFRLHVASMEWANKELNNQISSIELGKDENQEDRQENEGTEKEKESDKEMEGREGKKNEESTESTQPQPSSTRPKALHVTFRLPPATRDHDGDSTQQSRPIDPPQKEEGTLDRNRSCLETVQKKYFWSPLGQYVPVRIAS